MESTIILITLILEKGVPLALKLMQTLPNDREPTLEEIQELKNIKDPEDYFKES